MKRLIALMLCLLMVIPALPSNALENVNPFKDVDEAQWYYDAVIYAYNNGIFKGTDSGGTLFSPDRTMTRAEFITTLFRIAGANEDDYQGQLPFDDVNEGEWMSAPIKWAAENSVVSGNGNGGFNPNGKLNREQLAVILYNYCATHSDVSYYDTGIFQGFADKESVSDWALPAVKWMVGVGLLTGTGNNNLSPKMTATRSQAAQILKRYLEDFVPDEVIDIGTDRMLFTDDYIVNTDITDAINEYGVFEKKEAVFYFDAAWENRDAVYHNISQAPDGTYRMYYKGTDTMGVRRICYIESTDGINWSRPELTYNTLNGRYYSTNIVTNDETSPDNLFVFYDTNPDCPDGERWKGIYGQWADGLFIEYSIEDMGTVYEFWPDYVQIMYAPAESEGCFYDSLNTIYWDETRGKYVAFVRGVHCGDDYDLTREFVIDNPEKLTRDVRYAESDDCINWTIPVPIEFSDDNDWQMYTNGVTPYERGGIYIGLPTKFTYDPMSTVSLFMSSRDLMNWERNTEPVMVSPNAEYGAHGDCYACVGYIQTAEDELSFYMKEWDPEYYCMVLYRYTIRLDGFRSRGSLDNDSTVVTKLLTFEGDSLELNHEGDVLVSIKDTKGNILFENLFTGDNIASTLELGDVLAEYRGKPVSVNFKLDNARLYSFKFN